MNRKLIAVLIANLFATPYALAEGDFKLEGNIGVGGLYSTDSGTKDRAKLEEYQDLSNGAAGYFGLKGRGSEFKLDGYGENIGRDDMYVDFWGGRYDTFSYRIYTNWLTHNFGFGPATRTPYSNPGSANMTAPFPSYNTNVPPWVSFDSAYDRRDTGASFGWQSASPWYARVDFNQVRKDGNYNYAASNGSSPGNGFVDLAAPIDYTTNNLNLEGGYASRDIIASVAALWSTFDNSNQTFSWTNPYFGLGRDTTTAPPDNDFFKISANGVIRNLGWKSQISARVTYSTTEDSVPLLQQMLNTTTGGFAPITANTTVFDGKKTNTTISLAWAAVPTRGLDTKVYYNYYKQEDDSTDVVFNPSALNCTDFAAPTIIKPSVPCTTEAYDYKKNNFGFNTYYRLDPANRFGGGWDHWDIDREGTNYDTTTTNTFWVEWSTQMIPDSTLRLKYAYQQRRSDYLLGTIGISPADPIWLERYTSQFDQQNRDQNLVKLTFDTSLAPMVDLGLEFTWQDNSYRDVTLGRTDDTRYGVFASLGFGDPRGLRSQIFADYEKLELNATHRYIGAGNCGGTGPTATGPNCFDPNSPPFPQAYNWSNSNKDDSWLLGVSASYPVSESLKLTGSYLYGRNSGGATISAQVGNPLPINNYDTYTQSSFNLRADYQVNRNWSLSGGYTYQSYDWIDDQWNNFQYLAPPPPAALNTSTSYLNGVYAFPNYTTNIFWLIARYAFQ